MKEFSESINCIHCENSSKCFKKLIPSELEFINQNKTQVFYRKGESVCKQGAYTSYVLYLTEGLIKIYLETSNQKNINIKILKASEFLGLSSIFLDNIYNYSAVTLRDSTVCLIEKESFKKLISNNGAFASELINWYCKNEIHSYDILRSLLSKQMYGRLADVLLYLSGDHFTGEDIFSYITRKDISEFAGISMESTVRLLNELKNDEIIKTEGKKISILNRDLLLNISRSG